MELFLKIVNGFQPLNILQKHLSCLAGLSRHLSNHFTNVLHTFVVHLVCSKFTIKTPQPYFYYSIVRDTKCYFFFAKFACTYFQTVSEFYNPDYNPKESYGQSG